MADEGWWVEMQEARDAKARARLAVAEKALGEIEAAEPQSIGTREVHDGEAWKQFEFRHARRIARAALAEIRGGADA